MANQVEELESAIMERANRLATEYRQRAEHSRDNILRDAHERLHLREEREVLLAKSKSERIYRRLVQANELKLHKEMDHLRWNLVQGVQEQLCERMKALTGDRARYRELIKSWLAHAGNQFHRKQLVARVNASDLQWLQEEWEVLARAALPDKEVTLSTLPIETLGGILLQSEDNRVRLDNTFEGRLERLGPELHQVIIERLLPNASTQTTNG
jgi:V/A-type H+-transporting ATPase subunit E